MPWVTKLGISVTPNLHNNTTHATLIRLQTRTLSQPLGVRYSLLLFTPAIFNRLLRNILLNLASLRLSTHHCVTLNGNNQRKPKKHQARKNQERTQHAPKNTPVHSRPCKPDTKPANERIRRSTRMRQTRTRTGTKAVQKETINSRERIRRGNPLHPCPGLCGAYAADASLTKKG
jgi:hypothetical protein